MKLLLILFASVLFFQSCASTERNPVASKMVAPNYPPLAMTAGVASDVRILAMIDSGGAVQSVQVMAGHPLLDASAIAAAEQWSFDPGRSDRQAQLTFTFRLGPPSPTDPAIAAVFSSPYRVEIVGKLPQPTVNY